MKKSTSKTWPDLRLGQLVGKDQTVMVVELSVLVTRCVASKSAQRECARAHEEVLLALLGSEATKHWSKSVQAALATFALVAFTINATGHEDALRIVRHLCYVYLLR